MTRRSSPAFTLIEMLMVMVIIAIIAGLVVGVAGYAQKKAAATRTAAEIEGLRVACESYKTDNGDYPRESGTTEAPTGGGASPIDPRLHGNPSTSAYQNASRFLYQQLSGDANLDGRMGDNVDGTTAKVYGEIKPSMIGFNSSKTQVLSLNDPYGMSFGYSTAGAQAEDAYREKARATKRTGTSAPGVARDGAPAGYNATFDLWSTAGTTTTPPNVQTQAKWVKNW